MAHHEQASGAAVQLPLKAGERRALSAVLRSVRCPSCNHQNLGLAETRSALNVLCWCGYHGPTPEEAITRMRQRRAANADRAARQAARRTAQP